MSNHQKVPKKKWSSHQKVPKFLRKIDNDYIDSYRLMLVLRLCTTKTCRLQPIFRDKIGRCFVTHKQGVWNQHPIATKKRTYPVRRNAPDRDIRFEMEIKLT